MFLGDYLRLVFLVQGLGLQRQLPTPHSTGVRALNSNSGVNANIKAFSDKICIVFPG